MKELRVMVDSIDVANSYTYIVVDTPYGVFETRLPIKIQDLVNACAKYLEERGDEYE